MGRFCLFSFIFQLPFYTLVFSEWGCFFLLVRLGRGDTKDFLSLSKKVLVTLIYVICSFFSAARRTNQEAPPQLSGFWLFATVAVGVCGTRSAQTVLALFPPSPLRLHRPIKAESGIVAFACILTPSPYGHSPYIFAAQNTPQCCGTRQGESVRFDFVTVAVFLTPPSFGHLPYILLYKTPRNATGHGRGGEVFSFRFCSDFIRDTL